MVSMGRSTSLANSRINILRPLDSGPYSTVYSLDEMMTTTWEEYMTGRSIFITGASKGIGQATALYLDSKGFSVFAGVRSPDDAAALAKSASERLLPLILDITNQEQIAQAASQVK